MAIVTTIIFMVVAIFSVLALFVFNAIDINYLSYKDEVIAEHVAAKKSGKKAHA